jgi:hypothetical protein
MRRCHKFNKRRKNQQKIGCATVQNYSFIHLGASLHYISKVGGWVGPEKGQFLLTFSTIHADAGWVGQKKSINVLT